MDATEIESNTSVKYMAKVRHATIIITPDEDNKMQCITGDVSAFEIVDALQVLSKHFATVLVEEAIKAVGNNPKAQEKWLDDQRRRLENRNQN